MLKSIESRVNHTSEKLRWQEAGHQAVQALGNYPTDQQALAENLARARFVDGSRQMVVSTILSKAEEGDLYIVSTTSDDNFNTLSRNPFINPEKTSILDAAGLYNHDPNTKVGILLLRPGQSLTSEDRAALMAHELVHAEFASQGLHERSSNFNIRSLPVSAIVADEASAYLAEAAVFESLIGDDYVRLEEEIFTMLKQYFTSRGKTGVMTLEGSKAVKVSEYSPVALAAAETVSHIRLVEEGVIPPSMLEASFGGVEAA